MKIYKKILGLFLLIISLLSVCGCTQTDNTEGSNKLTDPSASNVWGDIDFDPSNNNSWDAEIKPNVNVSIIGGSNSNNDPMIEAASYDAEISELVLTAVQGSLESVGFKTSHGYAFDINNPDNNVMGIYYYADYFDIHSTDEIVSCGFVEVYDEIYGNDDTFLDSDSEIVVMDIDPTLAVTNYFAYAYDYETIGFGHFVYKNKYVQFNQVSNNSVSYKVLDNTKENYNLSYGSLYDYDKNEYIYDEEIFEEYKPHYGIQLFGEEDYNKLEENLKQLSQEQLKNGFIVEEYNIVYISPESIQAYLSSNEEETFFGYNVKELTEAFGIGTALTFNGNEFEKSQILPGDDYNWKSFLIKCGIGCGIILVGAVLSPITGGASFTCALVTITKIAVTTALTEGLGTLAIETVSGLIRGEDFEDALNNASHKGLDAFANGFMIGAAIGSVGVITKSIKPVACFTSGTLIALGNDTFKCIENININDYVLSYDEVTKQLSSQKVIDIFEKEVYQTLNLVIDGKLIETTYNHPFYCPTYDSWRMASDLCPGDYVLSSTGQLLMIEDKFFINHYEPVKVYNFTVENNHTYFVGEDEVLVHNDCDELTQKEINNARAKASRKAKKEALDDLKALQAAKGKELNASELAEWGSKYGFDMTSPDVRKIADFANKNKRFPSFRRGDGMQCDFGHAINVNDIVNAYKKGIIGKDDALKMIADPRNGVLTSRTDHLKILHQGKWTNSTDYTIIIKLRKSVSEVVKQYFGMVNPT